MNLSQLRAYLLQVYFILNRQSGWIVATAGLLCMTGMLCWALFVPHLKASLAQKKQEITRLNQAVHAAPNTTDAFKPIADKNSDVFYETLGDRRYEEGQLKILFAIAKKTELSVSQAEYRSFFDKNGGFVARQVNLPVKGSYGAIRQFCEMTLMTFPYASLDVMTFKRETIGKGGLEAKLRFTFYLSNTPVSTEQSLSAAVERVPQS